VPPLFRLHLIFGSNQIILILNTAVLDGGMLLNFISIGNQSIQSMARGMTLKCIQFICLRQVIIILDIRLWALFLMLITMIRMLLKMRLIS